MAEKQIDKIKRLVNNPEKIRNIGVAAHIDHGKCVSGKTRMQLSDGTIITAKDLFDIAQKKGMVFEENDSEIIYDTSKLGIEIFSLNKETGKIEKKPVSMAWKLDGGDTIKLKLRNGFEITTTPEHKYITLENMEFAEKEASDLKLGDRVVCSRKLETSHDAFSIKTEILNALSRKNFYIRLNKDYGSQFKENILKEGL
ncbi:MAG: hypothetical protein ABIB71_05050 [Candidatus Woesearchaeota archaeon]